MELEEFGKYLDDEIIDNYNDILLGKDKTKIYILIMMLSRNVSQSLLLNKKNQLTLLKNNVIYLVSNINTADLSLENTFEMTRYILKSQYKCLNTLKSELKDASLDKVASIYLYFNLLTMLGDESIKYCENEVKKYELAQRNISFISNNKISLSENISTLEKLSIYVKKIKSVY